MTDNAISPQPPCDTERLARKIRKHAIRMTHLGKSSHVGSVLSMADVLAVLYGNVLRLDSSNPGHPGRDRFILSKGHGGAGVYAALAERGFFPIETLDQHYQNGSILSGHVSHKGVPGVELSTGSLGHGLGVGAGMALSAQRTGRKHEVHVVLSDGECDEGSNWEAILFAGHFALSNLIATIDYNGIQSLAPVAETLNLEPFSSKWEMFGWHVLEVDGHSHAQLADAYRLARAEQNRPSVVIARTTKGKGVSFMENQVLWHYRSPQGEEYFSAIKEIEGEGDA